MATDLKPNEGKKGVIEVDGVQYLRLPIPTQLITDQDNICDVAQQYGAPLLQPGMCFSSRKVRSLYPEAGHSHGRRFTPGSWPTP
ncbi:MAG: hypothetical protein ACLSHU_01895 [Oscillospiraceae bacterium]